VQSLSSGQVVGYLLLDLALIVIAARMIGSAFIRAGQPRVVGEIVAGVLLGPTLLGATLWGGFSAPDWMSCAAGLAAAPLGTLESPTWCLFPAQVRPIINGIGQTGLLLFMFLTGLEFDLGRIGKRLGRRAFAVGIGVVATPMALGLLIGPALSSDVFKPAETSEGAFALFIGALLSVTAFPVMARILEERGLTQTRFGTMAMAAAALCTVLMFMSVAGAASVAIGASPREMGVHGLWIVGFLAFTMFLMPRLLARICRPYVEGGPLDSTTFAIVLTVALVLGYATHELGLSVVVGGFLGGLAMPARRRLLVDMNTHLGLMTRTVLLPVFLAFSGLAADFTALTGDALAGVALLVAVGVTAKWAGGAVVSRLAGISWQEGRMLGVLMNCRGLLPLVVALQGIEAGITTPAIMGAAVILALVTTAMTGPTFDLAATGYVFEDESPTR
jgi:Kef-type K+ transport system membrane component KefB